MDCLYWAAVTITSNKGNGTQRKKKKQPNALQRTCSASLVRSASLSSSVMGSIFQCSSCREMKYKLNKTLLRMGREGQAPESRSTHQVSATGSNWENYFPTPSFNGLLVNRRVKPWIYFRPPTIHRSWSEGFCLGEERNDKDMSRIHSFWLQCFEFRLNRLTLIRKALAANYLSLVHVCPTGNFSWRIAGFCKRADWPRSVDFEYLFSFFF